MPSTTNRPFFANFFAAFRAQSAYQKASPVNLTSPTGSSTAAAATSAAAAPASSSTPSNPRAISTRSTATSAAVTAAAQFHSSRTDWHGSSPVAYPCSPPSPGPQSPPPAGSSFQQRSRTPSETRSPQPLRKKTSSSSNDSGSARPGAGGMVDVFAGGNWYVGGRTANGEERFYKLGMVKKYNSEDRLSLDRLSL